MRTQSFPALVMAFAAAALSTQARAAEALRGDARNGAAIFSLECASCHGVDGAGSDAWKKASFGKGLGELPDLTDAAFLAQASDVQLRRAIRTGVGRNGWIPGHAFGEAQSSLETWDVVQWLRDGAVRVTDVYPDARQFTAKDFELDEFSVKRLKETLGLTLSKERQTVVVLSVYGGGKKRQHVRLVPWTPVERDLLKETDRQGFLVFDRVVLPGEKEKVTLGLGIGKEGKLTRIVLRHGDPKKRAELQKSLDAFVGQGDKRLGKLKAPKGLKNGPAWEKLLTDTLGRAWEGATMWEKAERERTAFDRK